MKWGIDEVPKLVQDYLEENISLENFDKTLQPLIHNNSVKSNSVLISVFSPYQKMIIVERISI